MRVFFSAPINGRELYEQNYKKIVDDLKSRGFKVQSDHVLNVDKNKLQEISDRSRIEYYRKLVRWISESDFIIAEVSRSSVSIGHEITLALEKGKNVIALSCVSRGPAILLALKSEKLQMVKYNLNDLHSVLDKAIEKARSKTDIRFNFFVSPEINEYLDWISRVKRIPRAVYLRGLLEKDMAKTKEFKTS